MNHIQMVTSVESVAYPIVEESASRREQPFLSGLFYREVIKLRSHDEYCFQETLASKKPLTYERKAPTKVAIYKPRLLRGC